MKSEINEELSAEIRNYLQSCKSVLEAFKLKKKVSKRMIEIAIKDLEKVLVLI
jgi:hypothetical protein